jgi:hypothetical protein
MVVHGRRGERAVVLADDLLRLPMFELVAPGKAELQAAFAAFVAYGRGSRHPAGLNYGDLFSYALAKVRGLPLLIITAIPLGIAGGPVGLVLLNLVGGLLPKIGLMPLSQPFDMITMLGFLILMGTAVNNPILVVDQARQNLRQEGMSVVDVVVGAVETRLRPIAMTTLTTICGLSPLVFLPGEGTELYRGVGVIVLFGLMGAATVTVTLSAGADCGRAVGERSGRRGAVELKVPVRFLDI